MFKTDPVHCDHVQWNPHPEIETPEIVFWLRFCLSPTDQPGKVKSDERTSSNACMQLQWNENDSLVLLPSNP